MKPLPIVTSHEAETEAVDSMLDLTTSLQDIASLATAAGVFAAVWQLRMGQQQASSQFEDSLNEQYRDLLAHLPLDALLGKPISTEELESSLRAFYRYFDLSNEEAFLRRHGRVRRRTWLTWREGIEQNLDRPAFRQAWEALLPHLDGSFEDLKALLASRH